MFNVRLRFVFVLLLSIYSFGNIWFTVGERLFDFEISAFHLFVLLFAEVLFIWELNRVSELWLIRKVSVAKSKIHPLIILFAISLVNVTLVSSINLTLLYASLGMPLTWSFDQFILLLVFGFRVNLFLNCVNAIYYYVERLKRSELLAEQLKKVSVEARFEALRNQINPHFLFNCLNALSNLVYKSPDISAKFIDQLSKVYRYLLYNQEKTIVTLQEELDFIESYVYLLKIRFGENIFVDKLITTDVNRFHIAPATLQMLIENAIKHNVVSSKSPLTIRIKSINGSITVSNTLQEKQVKEQSSYIGLNNIMKRYEFLSSVPVVILKTDDEFSVKVPLVEIENG
jgi:two-component system, LytTR family, sensor kinase